MSEDLQHQYAKYVEELSVSATKVTSQIIAGQKPTPDEPPVIKRPLRFGGLDLAKRIDHSALEVLKFDEGMLKEDAYKEWGHTNYKIVAQATYFVNKKLPMEMIGFDRSGVGDAASELFDKSSIPLNPIVTTMNRKIDIIHILRALFHKGMLQVDRMTDLPTQIEEQEEQINQKTGNLHYEHPVGRHDDRFWALGYACFVAIPYIIGQVPPNIKIGSDQTRHFGERDVEAELEEILEKSISSF